MTMLTNPKWIDKELLQYQKLQDVPNEVYLRIKNKLNEVVSDNPLVTLIIAAYNEELNILKCLDSLSKNESEYPFDIIVVNNNSNDKTQDTLDRLGINNLFQEIQGCGPARQLGQENARGKYILLADADCLYPKKYIESLTKGLLKEGVVVVYGNYSFLTNSTFRINMMIYEFLRNIIIRIRHFKRPYLNTLGISMGYIKELGLKEKYIDHNTRGEDGRLTFDLMKYGKVKYLKSRKNQVWTSSRTLNRDGSLIKAFASRVIREISLLDLYLKKEKPHNTKSTITNMDEYSIKHSMNRIKNKFNATKDSDNKA